MEVEKAVTPTLAVLTVTLMASLWYWLQKRPHPNFPPGPRGWPIIGNLTDFRGVGPHHLFMSLAEKYGNIFSIKIGVHWNVVLNGSETIKEALIKLPVEFAGEILFEGGTDIAFSQYTPTWKLHRKLAHSAFRTFATANSKKFEGLVFSVADKVSKILEEKGRKAFDPKNVISLTIYNFLAQMVFGKKYELDDPELVEWMSLSEETIELLGNGPMANFFPILQHVPTKGTTGLKKLIVRFKKLAMAEITKHMENYDPNTEPRDLVEMLYNARQKMIDEGEEGIDQISETHIRQTVLDVFTGGTDTSTYTLHWAVACLVDHPDVQEKVQKEIDEVIGPHRRPKLDDRGTLPYTECTLCEVFRYSSLVPLSLPHATTCDVNLEHFLNESGKMRQHPEGFLPFSTGRRVCLGESVAKAELFLIFTWLFQNFTFTKPPGKETEMYSSVDQTALTRVLKDYDVIVTKRS